MTDDRSLDEMLFRDDPNRAFGFYDWRRCKKPKNRKGRWRKRDRRTMHRRIRSGFITWVGPPLFQTGAWLYGMKPQYTGTIGGRARNTEEWYRDYPEDRP